MSLSLALGILVGDLGGYKLLTRAHAQENPCGWGDNNATLVSDSVNIEDGLILSGIIVRNITVNGAVLEQAMIAGNVQLNNVTVLGTTGTINADGVIVGGDGGDGPTQSGVIVGGDGGTTSPCINGVIVGGDGGNSPTLSGVIVGGDGGDEVNLGGASVSSSGTASGGTLTGDNITITDGVITGENLLLSGATIDGGSINGSVTSVSISPAN